MTVKLTSNERRALREFAVPPSKRNGIWDRIHGHTLHALERKKLIKSSNGKGWQLTAAGRAELAIPDVFADLFPSPPASIGLGERWRNKRTQRIAIATPFRHNPNSITYRYERADSFTRAQRTTRERFLAAFERIP